MVGYGFVKRVIMIVLQTPDPFCSFFRYEKLIVTLRMSLILGA